MAKTEIQELSEFIRDHMVTKNDMAELRKDMATKDDLAKLDVKIDKLDISIHRELESIKEQLTNVIGYRKEIDYALERIATIEKHLGIEKNIAA